MQAGYIESTGIDGRPARRQFVVQAFVAAATLLSPGRSNAQVRGTRDSEVLEQIAVAEVSAKSLSLAVVRAPLDKATDQRKLFTRNQFGIIDQLDSTIEKEIKPEQQQDYVT